MFILCAPDLLILIDYQSNTSVTTGKINIWIPYPEHSPPVKIIFDPLITHKMTKIGIIALAEDFCFSSAIH